MNMQGPGMGNPGMGRPGMEMPPMGQPGMGQPGMQSPNMRPPMSNPGMPNPGIQNPNLQNPNMPTPNNGRPGMGPMNAGRPGLNNPVMGNPAMGNPNMGRPGMGRQAAPTRADIASSRLAREIEKSVSGERDAEKSDRPERPQVKLGLRRSGRPSAGFGSITIPSNVLEGISGFSAYIYGGILVLCLVIALIAYGKDHKGGAGKTLSIPTDMITYTGIFRNAYDAAMAGSLSEAGSNAGVLYDDDGTEVPPAPTAAGEEGPSATDVAASSDEGTTDAEGSVDAASSSSAAYGQAESYKELLSQIEKAIAEGDTAFIASKMAYEDESGALKAYPQTVIEHFVTYMSANPEKRSTLMTDLSSDKYSGQNEGEFIVKLPYIKFTVNMGYDNTTISIPGFTDQVVNAGQSADIAPLMPCMYTLTISNPDWNDVVTRDIEANINESTISINIKP